MAESLDSSPTTGDPCALCGASLDEHSEEIEGEDGALLLVCRLCATRAASPAGRRTRALSDADEARAALAALAERRQEENRVLDQVAELLLGLTAEVERWQASAIEAQDEAGLLAAELARARDRLRKAEDLLAVVAGAEALLTEEQETDSAAAQADEAGARPSDVTADGSAARRPSTAEGARGVGEARFSLEEVRIAQRHFNESPFPEKMRSVRRSLGRPSVGLVKVAGHGSKALLTVAWEIVWYQYLLDLDESAPPDSQTTLFAEGMELGELADHFKQTNANLDDDGRLDASELEVSLLHDEAELLTHFSPEQEAALDDATEEIWDRHTQPEFRWDD